LHELLPIVPLLFLQVWDQSLPLQEFSPIVPVLLGQLSIPFSPLQELGGALPSASASPSKPTHKKVAQTITRTNLLILFSLFIFFSKSLMLLPVHPLIVPEEHFGRCLPAVLGSAVLGKNGSANRSLQQDRADPVQVQAQKQICFYIKLPEM
jgi:hypothetical protein